MLIKKGITMKKQIILLTLCAFVGGNVFCADTNTPHHKRLLTRFENLQKKIERMKNAEMQNKVAELKKDFELKSTELAKITCPICTENFCRMCKINHDCRNVCKKPVKPTKRYVSDLSGLCEYCTHMSEVTCATCEHSMCVTCSMFHSCKQN